MRVFLNGRLVPEHDAVISVFDRSFLYGDGLFETMLVCGGKPFRWDQHLQRLRRGAQFLQIRMPFTATALRAFADELIAKNETRDGLLRLTLSRGVGPRGYSPRGAHEPTVVMSLHASNTSAVSGMLESNNAPRSWNLISASFRLPAHEAVARFKTCNKLAQILARAEADAAGADEALLLNTDGHVVEGASSNLFWIERDAVCTAPLPSGILAGVTRAVVLELCGKLGTRTREACITPDELRRADGVFMSLSSLGIVAAESLDGTAVKMSPLTDKLRVAYDLLVRAETSA